MFDFKTLFKTVILPRLRDRALQMLVDKLHAVLCPECSAKLEQLVSELPPGL